MAITAQVPVEINQREVIVEVGRYIEPDGWRIGQILTAGDECSSFRIPTGYDFGVTSLAVEVKVTGRTFQRRNDAYWVRVGITFVHDCDGEPNVEHKGWMCVEYLWK